MALIQGLFLFDQIRTIFWKYTKLTFVHKAETFYWECYKKDNLSKNQENGLRISLFFNSATAYFPYSFP